LNTVPDRYGQTDGRTDRRLTVALPRSALASRGKNGAISPESLPTGGSVLDCQEMEGSTKEKEVVGRTCDEEKGQGEEVAKVRE